MATEQDTLDDENTTDVDETTGAEQQDADEWQAPTREDWDNLQLALKKARQDARAAKREAKAAPKPDADAPDVDKVAKDAADAAAARYKPMVVKAAARAAFAEAGLVMPKGKADVAMSRVIRLLDLDDLDIDDDGQVSGLDEQIDDIKGDFPELFASTRRPPRVDGADKSASSGKLQSSADALAAQIFGGR